MIASVYISSFRVDEYMLGNKVKKQHMHEVKTHADSCGERAVKCIFAYEREKIKKKEKNKNYA